MPSNIFSQPDLLMQYYQKQADEMRMRHEAIWDEIKHYTWLLSLLLTSPIGIYLNYDPALQKRVFPLLLVLPLLGFIFSIIAFFVVRREFHLYNAVDARLLYIEKHLGLASRKDFLDEKLKKSLAPDFSVSKHIENSRPSNVYKALTPWKSNIRSLFLFGFLIFSLLSIGEFVLIIYII